MVYNSPFDSQVDSINYQFLSIDYLISLIFYWLTTAKSRDHTNANDQIYFILPHHSYLKIMYLCHDNLFSSKKRSKVIIKILLLFITLWTITDPKFLRISLKLYIQQTNRKDDENGQSSHDNDSTITIVESTNFLEYNLEVKVHHEINEINNM